MSAKTYLAISTIIVVAIIFAFLPRQKKSARPLPTINPNYVIEEKEDYTDDDLYYEDEPRSEEASGSSNFMLPKDLQ